MPRVRNPTGLDKREKTQQHLARGCGLDYLDVRKGYREIGQLGPPGTAVVQPPTWEVIYPHGRVPPPAPPAPPSGDCATGRWRFNLACQSAHLITAGF
jgi:hypothetical protein